MTENDGRSQSGRDYEEYGVYRDALAQTGEEGYARWVADTHPFGAIDIPSTLARYLRRQRFGELGARLAADCLRLWEKAYEKGPSGSAEVDPYEEGMFIGHKNALYTYVAHTQRALGDPDDTKAHLRQVDQLIADARHFKVTYNDPMGVNL